MTWAQNYDGMVESEVPSNPAGSAQDAIKKKVLDEQELTTLILVEKLNEFAVISKHLDKADVEDIVADIVEALLCLFDGDDDRSSDDAGQSREGDYWIEGVKESNLHLMIFNYLEMMNVNSEASNDAKIKLVAVLELLSKMSQAGLGLEDFLIWKSGEDEISEEKDVKEDSPVEGDNVEVLGKNKCVYS